MRIVVYAIYGLFLIGILIIGAEVCRTGMNFSPNLVSEYFIFDRIFLLLGNS